MRPSLKTRVDSNVSGTATSRTKPTVLQGFHLPARVHLADDVDSGIGKALGEAAHDLGHEIVGGRTGVSDGDRVAGTAVDLLRVGDRPLEGAVERDHLLEQILTGSVSATLRVVRSKRATPISLSRRAMCRLRGELAMCRRRAAFEKLSSSATVLK